MIIINRELEMKYDIFISYKRKGASSATAAYLYEILLQKGYNVFFDRKEMRSGKFNEQLLEHISNATDIIILLEEESLGSWFNYRTIKKRQSVSDDDPTGGFEQDSDSDFQEEPYKSDWFCKEVIYSLSLEGKNIIPILLNGYTMPEVKDLPPEMADLSLHNALSLEISEAPEFYEKYFVEQGYERQLIETNEADKYIIYRIYGQTANNYFLIREKNGIVSNFSVQSAPKWSEEKAIKFLKSLL